jgi:hypothetical protein
LLTYALLGSTVSLIDKEVKNRMLKGNSWKPSCPVGLSQLRYLRIKYMDFEGRTQTGEMIVHADVARSVIEIFDELYEIKYPIHKMKLVSDFKGKDFASIEADNTSALNCRPITGNSKKWSNHAYGKAIDINPIANPYIARNGHISHPKSLKYRKRVHQRGGGNADKAMLLKQDKATKIFEKYGWKWGGDWNSIKDYQHFEYISRQKPKTFKKPFGADLESY